MTLTLAKVEPGMWRGTAKADELGLYRLTDGTLNTVTAAGPLNPKEVADMRATDAILKPVASATGGSVHWLADGGIPKSAACAPGDAARRRLDRPARQRRLSRDVRRADAAAARLARLAAVLGTLLIAWRMEGR